MADNIVLNAGSLGATLAADDIGGVHTQIVKVSFGALDTATAVTSGEGLPVTSENFTLTANSGVDIGDVTINNGGGAASVPVQGQQADAAAPAGNPVLIAGDDTSVVRNIHVDAAGDLQVDVLSSVAIDASAAVVTVDLAGNNDVTIDGSSMVGTDGGVGPADTLSVAGTESGGNIQELRVDSDGHLQVDILSSVALDVSAATVTVDLGANNDVTIDGSSMVGTDGAAGPTQVMSIGGTESGGAIQEIRVDSDGHPQVDILTFPDNEPFDVAQIAGTATSVNAGNVDAGTQRVVLPSDQASLTVDAPVGTPVFVELSDGSALIPIKQLDLDSGAGDDTQLSVGIAGAASGGSVAIQGTAANGLEVDVTRVTGTVTVDGSGVTQPISGTVTANAGTGTFTVDGSGVTQPISGSVTADLGANNDVTIDGSSVVGTDGGAGPTDTLSVGGTESGGNIQELRVDSDGHLQIDVLSGGGSGTEFVDDTDTHSSGVTAGGVILAAATPTDGSVDANDLGVLAMSVDRRLHTDAQIVGQDSALDVSGATVTVDLGANNDVTIDNSSVVGTDGAAGPTDTLSVGGTESGGNIQEVRVDSDGHLQVDVLSGGIAGTEYVDDTDTHATGTTQGGAILAAATPTDGSVDANDMGVLAMSVDRRLHTDAQIVGTDSALDVSAATVTVDLGANNDVTIDNSSVVGTDGSTGPTDVLSVGGTESGGNIQELRVDSDGNLQVDIITFPDNEPFDVAQIAGTATSVNAGNVDAGTQRVVLASDQATVATSDTATLVDDDTFTPATSRVMMVGGHMDDTAQNDVEEGDGGAFRISRARGLHSSLRNDAGTEIATAANPIFLQGQQADAAAPASNPVMIAGDDTSVARNIHVDAAGDLQVDILSSVALDVTAATVIVDGSGVTQPVSINGLVTAGTDGGAGPAAALSIAGTAAGGTLQELLSDTDGHLQIDVLTAPTTAVTNAGLTELAAAINASSQMDVNIAASAATVTVDGSGVTQPVSGTVTAIAGTGTRLIEGEAAHSAADITANPVRIGATARAAIPTVVAAADTTDLYATLDGAAVVQIGAVPEQIVTGETNYTNTTAADVIAAQGAGIKIVVTSVTVTNVDATVDTTVELRDGTTVKLENHAVNSGGGWSTSDPKGLFITAANVAATARAVTTSADVQVSMSGFTIH